MFELDMQVALFIYIVIMIAGLLFSAFLLYAAEEKNVEYKEFITFYVLSMLGATLILFREDVGVFVSYIVANSLLLVGRLVLLDGIRRLYKTKSKIVIYVLIYILFIGPYIYFTYIDYQVVSRIIVSNIASILVMLDMFLIVSKLRKENRLPMIMNLAVIFSIVILITRIITVFLFNETTNQFLSFTKDSFMIVSTGLADILIIAGILSIITQLANQDLEESEKSKTSLLSNLPGFAFRCVNDEFWTMTYLSEGFERVTGFSRESVLYNKESAYEDLIIEEFREDVRIGVERAVEEHSKFVAEYKISTANNGDLWVWEQSTPLYNENGECYAIEGFVSNIDRRKNIEKNLEVLSYRDHLTGLYNRRFIEEQLTRLEKSRHLPISIIMGDINGLKFINDSFGHQHGDLVIQNVANILTSSLRGYEFISRLSGDEYMIILENTTFEQAKTVVERIEAKSAREEYTKMGISIALGYATKNSYEVSLSAVIKQAEDMMYQQKMYDRHAFRKRTIEAVLKTLFEKDVLSEKHTKNVTELSTRLASFVGLSEQEVKQTETAGMLHDIGKILIDQSILTSKYTLTKEQYEEIQKHVDIGYRILNTVPEYEKIANIILCHHERVDGTGYPNKLKGNEIPTISKILTICDAFDAMVYPRYYRKPMTVGAAFTELQKNSGKQFDRKLVESFIKMMKSSQKKTSV